MSAIEPLGDSAQRTALMPAAALNSTMSTPMSCRPNDRVATTAASEASTTQAHIDDSGSSSRPAIVLVLTIDCVVCATITETWTQGRANPTIISSAPTAKIASQRRY